MKIIKQDLLKVEKGVICHQVNCLGVAGGLAGAIFKKYPTAGKLYKNYVKSQFKPWSLLGNTQLIKVSDDLMIANMFAQYDIGTDCRKTEYGSFRSCIDTITCNLKYPYPKIYFPYLIGCGLGGGSWDIIGEIIDSLFWENFDVYVCRMD